MTVVAVHDARDATEATVDETAHLVAPRVVRQRTPRAWLRVALTLVVPVLVVAAWWIGTEQGWLSQTQFSSPAQVRDRFDVLVSSGQLQDNLRVSLQRAGLGLLFGGTIGLLLGIAAGLGTIGERLVDPTMQMLRTIPFLALLPLLIVWFGIDETPKVILIGLGAAFPLYINAYSGVRNVDRKIVEAGRAYGLSRNGLVRKVVLPLALPSILVGLRLSMTISVIALVAAEQVNASSGLGFLLQQGQQYFQTDTLFVVIVIYALLGVAIDLIVRVLERFLVPWRRSVSHR